MIIGAANLLIMLLILPIFNYDNGIKVYPKYEDALELAIDLGRLDAISILLTVFGILLATLALVGFGYIENQAAAIAEKTANKYAVEYFKTREDEAAQHSAISSTKRIEAAEIDTTRLDPEGGGDGNV